MIIQKNTLCTNKIRVIYFCPNCVNLLPENVYLFIYLFIYLSNFFWGGRGDCTPPPTPTPPARASILDCRPKLHEKTPSRSQLINSFRSGKGRGEVLDPPGSAMGGESFEYTFSAVLLISVLVVVCTLVVM